MSLDLYQHCDHCGSDLESVNVTYNLGKMWYAAAAAAGIDQHKLIQIEGLTGIEAKLIVRGVLDELMSDPETYRAMNPGNGWGSYEGLVEVAKTVYAACDDHPSATWGACR